MNQEYYQLVFGTLIAVVIAFLGWIGGKVNCTHTVVKAGAADAKLLVSWHAPNDKGIQTWKGDPGSTQEIIHNIDELIVMMRELVVEMKLNRSSN